ncbi:MAG: hypothetical protein ACFFCV_04475 [Promethearchaeota archaeon]
MKKSKKFKQPPLKRLKIRKSGVLKKVHISNKFKNIKMKRTNEVQISQVKKTDKFKNSRDVELERLRLKILDAVRYSKRFWMTYREKTFGIASILNLVYKRSFFEVLFFTNRDVIEKGVPLLKIYTPSEDEIDFGEIIVDPDFDDDGLVSPRKIIARMRKLIRSEFQKHLKRLDKEIELVDLKYENYPIDNNPYYREVRISFNFFTIELEINFEKYPLLPSYSFSKTLLKIISEREFNEEDIIRNWNEQNPPHLYQLIETIHEIVINKLKFDKIGVNSQHLILSNVSIENNISNVSFSIHRGKSIGILYDESLLYDEQHRFNLFYLLWAISGNYPEYSGKIEIFGRNILLLSKDELDKIFILPAAYDSKINNMKIKKAIKYKTNLKEILKDRKTKLDKMLKSAGFTQKIDQIMGDLFLAAPMRISRTKSYIKKALEVTGLLNKKNKVYSKLTQLEIVLFSIAKTLIQFPTIIMFLIPNEILNRLEYEKFNSYIEKIKKEFHVILIFCGPEGVISGCDQILTFKKQESKIESFENLIKELPRSGEIITVELNNPDNAMIKKLYDLDEIAKIQEERKNERYKIFLKDDPRKIILKLTELFGSSLFNFKRSKANLGDYVEFFEKI